jgi:hypothetical protein
MNIIFKILCIISLLCNCNTLVAQQIAEPTIDSQFLKDNGLLPVDKAATPQAVEQEPDQPVTTAAEAAAIEAVNSAEDADEDYEAEEKIALEKQTQEAIKNTKPITWRQLDTTAWQSLTADEAFNYSREVKKIEKKEKPTPSKKLPSFGFSKQIGIILLYALTAIVILVVLYSFFGDNYFAKKDAAIAPLENNDWEDVQKFDKWDEAINNAISNNDYRLATRILYLQSISKLDAANIIKYKKETTNSAYASSLFNASCYQHFLITTRIYDYVWYGKRQVGAAQFVDVKQAFDNLNKMIA